MVITKLLYTIKMIKIYPHKCQTPKPNNKTEIPNPPLLHLSFPSPKGWERTWHASGTAMGGS